ncbi:hypothetical protein [Staphylococcus auricularis]|uniref:hypothetical protein n=1 Tax=Staphylococcus auricularis TaxID=29379 RepID=UPI00242A5496|nr:hypothetical protein [Staphylococcus auricularis]
MRSDIEKIVESYVISGDSSGQYGLRKNANRRKKTMYYNDRFQSLLDWEKTGKDMEKSLNQYGNKKELTYG